jgi:hypothetical protein
MNNLACTWKYQGRNTEAINLMSECVWLRLKVLGVNHPDYIDSSTGLALWEAEQADIGSLTLEAE